MPELKDFMREYPLDVKSLLSEISNDNSKPRSGEKLRGVLSQLSANPFAGECRLITTQAAAKSTSQKLAAADDDELNLNEIEPDELPIAITKSIEFHHKSFKLRSQVICSPGLNLIKSLVKYIELMHIIAPCKDLTMRCLMDAYRYYVYCLFLIFTPAEHKQTLMLSSPMNLEQAFLLLKAQAKYPKLAKYLMRVKNNLQNEQIPVEELLPTTINDMVKLNDGKSLNAACEKIVAAESCYYILEALHKLKARIEVRSSLTMVGMSGRKPRKASAKQFLDRNKRNIATTIKLAIPNPPSRNPKGSSAHVTVAERYCRRAEYFWSVENEGTEWLR